MSKKGFHYVLMAPEDDASGGGGSAGAGQGESVGADQSSQSGADSTGSTGTAAGTSSGSSTQENALQQAAQAQAPAIPEKFHVKKEDGTLDLEASSLKLAENYAKLEKRIGTGDIPPKAAEDYTVAIPDAMKDMFDLDNDEAYKGFRADAHKAGLTQAQFDFVMGQYFERAPALVNGAQQLSADDCTAELKKTWTSPEQFKSEVGNAFKAAQGFFGDDAQYIIDTYGNDPRLIRGLAKIGGEMNEDRSVNPGPGSNRAESIESLQASEAYMNPKHPDHQRVSKQVQEHYNKVAEANAKTGAVPIF